MNKPKKRDENNFTYQRNNTQQNDKKILIDSGINEELTSTIRSPLAIKSYAIIHNHGQQDSQYQKQQAQPQQLNLEEYFQDMKKKLQIIFTFYAALGNRIKVNYLKANKIHKMLLDSGLKNLNGFDSREIDILYAKVNRNKTNMDFETFLQMLHKIVDIIFPTLELDKGLVKLLECHFKPLYESVIIQSEQKEEDTKSKEHFEQIVPSNCKSTSSQDESSIKNSSKRTTAIEFVDSRSSRSTSQISRIPTEESNKIIESCQDQLLQIYKMYCGVNQATGLDNLMTGAKWHKLLKNANLIQNNDTLYNQCRIPYSEIDLMYIKACSTADQRRRALSTESRGKQPTRQQMNFKQFISAIHLLSQKVYSHIDSKEAMTYILSENLLPLRSQIYDCESQMKTKLTVLMNLLKDSQIVELLGLLHKSLMVYYKYYSNAQGLISFEKFLRFYKEFDIFPDLLPKNKIINIFQTLAKLYEQNNCKKDLQEIDQHMFIESLALTALEMSADDDVGNLERICYLIERMNQSDGPQIVQRQIGHTYRPNSQRWDMLGPIKKQFPWIFAEEVKQTKNLF